MNPTFSVSPLGDRALVMTRKFRAPRALIFDAYTKPDLVRQWLLGPPGWTMPVCEIDLRVGGRYRYVWRNAHGTEMGMGGVFREIVRPDRLVATGKFDEAWYPGEEVSTIVLVELGGLTTLTQTVEYESEAARDMVAKSPATSGMAAGFDRLEEVLATLT